MSTTTAIAEQIREFIQREILADQDSGLAMTTPLLELGILDSFGIFKLIAHLNERHAIGIAPAEIVGKDFKDIDSIASLVARHLGPAPPAPAAPVSGLQPEGVAVFEAPTCAQVFIMFTGLIGLKIPDRLFGAAQEIVADSLLFFKRAGLDDRNIILLHDTRGETYKHGVSAELPTEEKVFEWLAGWIGQRPHVEEVYCIGVSAGGPVAMLAGRHLGARTVWAFAPRSAAGTVAKDTHRELLKVVLLATGKSFHELTAGMTPSDRDKIDAAVTPAMVEAYHTDIADPDKVLDVERLERTVEILSRGTGTTEHRVYYVPRDKCDAWIADLLKRCPDVTLVPVEPFDAPPPTWAFSRWVPPPSWVQRDHLVVDVLRQRGIFGTLFPPFRAIGTAAASSAASAPAGMPAHQ